MQMLLYLVLTYVQDHDGKDRCVCTFTHSRNVLFCDAGAQESGAAWPPGKVQRPSEKIQEYREVLGGSGVSTFVSYTG